MFGFFSNLLGAIGHFFDYLKQKRLADAIEDKNEAIEEKKEVERELEMEREYHKRTIEIFDIDNEVRDVQEAEVKKKTRRIEG